MSALLNDDNSNSDEELKINSDYANNYNNWRQKEELNKLKTKYGENIMDASVLEDESSDSSSSESEEENIKTLQFDKDFYKTLAYLKKKDPCIYDDKVKFFNDIDKLEKSENNEANEKIQKKKKEKALFLRDYERKFITEKNGQFSSSEDEDYIVQKQLSVQEEQQLKSSFKNPLNFEDEDEHTNVLTLKQRPEKSKGKSCKNWLKGQELEIDFQDQEDLKSLRNFWTDPNLGTDDKFLRDYILNDKHMDEESSSINRDYNQTAHDSDENFEEDENNINKQEEFEHKYNFRFEEPDQEFIKRYPRTMENSMRKKDTRRTQKRAEVKQRKEKEKQQKREELKQLKILKRKEIEEKIEKLKEITGNNDMCFDNVDFDADFEPDEYDKKMKELFNEEYYACVEDDMKPEFPEIDEELDIERTWDNYDPTVDKIDTDAADEEPHCEDSDFNMDADYNKSQDLQSEMIENTKRRKRKRRSKFATLIAKEKPRYDPKQFPSYEEYFDQYYSLDYEDMIGDLPCRFKYRKVVPNDYGLSVEEILMADDKELNKWCSLKQALQHKPEYVEIKEVKKYESKAANKALKCKILKSLYTEPEEEKEENADIAAENVEETNNKKHRRKKSKAKTSDSNTKSVNIISEEKKVDILANNVQNESQNSRNDKKETKSMEDNNISNKKENKKKRKNNTKPIDGAPNPKKARTDSTEKNNSFIKENNVTEQKTKGKSAIIKNKNKTKRQSYSNKLKTINHNSCSNRTDQIMSLDAERLKTYGINAKKLRNKLKYGNKKM